MESQDIRPPGGAVGERPPSPQGALWVKWTPLTHCVAVHSHDALHGPDDLLHHGGAHGRGVDRAVGVAPQVVHQLLWGGGGGGGGPGGLGSWRY